jgi:pimeloyl-ACP methyl ester carboxylesterase
MLTTSIYFETHGEGIPLILSFPIFASPWQGDPELAVLRGYLDRLRDRYRVLVMDYPNLTPGVGKTAPIPAEEFTADRVAADLLRVADAAGFDRFAFWGFSWGGVIGLQLAARTDRLTALVCGGWPPLGAPYADMLTITRMMAAAPDLTVRVDQFATFYESIQGWPEEALSLDCPKLTFIGADDEMAYPDGITLHLASTIRDRRPELEARGWEVVEVPGKDHGLFTDPETAVPVVREFLDRVV